MVVRRSSGLTEALSLLAPGRPLREGLDRVLLAKRGALVVVGDHPGVLAICSGGFLLDSEFTPQRLSELAKMDGAIILTSDATRIARANVHLVPDPKTPTTETGTRHRTAERVARSLDVMVASVSQAMSVVTVYRGEMRHVLQPPSSIVYRATQALQTLERFKQRLDTVTGALSALEIQDSVTARDVATVLQRVEMVVRLAEELDGYLLELGDDGRMFRLQLEELMDGVDQDRRLVLRDYALDSVGPEAAGAALAKLAPNDLADLRCIVRLLGLEGADLDIPVEPRGYRMLQRIPRFPEAVVERIVGQFSTLQKIMRATVGDLEEVGGVGSARARSVKDGLARLAESSILESYSS
ncbi:MAG: DNA integrity scanning diadenylate cyclase DisA [Actinobacteria bacterium]|nr:DNA integrity scanning diadenylate cyclase DisA [Actinomycetota bacterium]